jgi:hypothetical protein
MAFHAVSNARIQLLDFCREVSEYALDDGSAAAAADLALGMLRKGNKMLDKVRATGTLFSLSPTRTACPLLSSADTSVLLAYLLNTRVHLDGTLSLRCHLRAHACCDDPC